MKRDPRRILPPVLCGLCVLFCYLFCWRYGVFGSKVDWISQHSVLPDYFRQQFYATGELFPEFALNLGGGQNIYNFAYYGLLSPLILPSYLLPFVKMGDYMMAVQFLCLTASVLLLYRWLCSRGFPVVISFGASCMFLLSGPMIYHSYNQIMFVNYMPFLILGLMGVDRYFDHKSDYRIGLLTAGIFLMIMTSFYFSVGGMLALAVYGLHRYCLEEGEGCAAGKGGRRLLLLLREAARFLLPFLLAVLMSCVLLLPAAYALLGREGSSVRFDAAELFLPELRLEGFLYSPYGIGLSGLGITALIAGILRGCGEGGGYASGGWRSRVLPVCCGAALVIPAFVWLLNGGLYIRDKAMIPFLPLLCYLAADYLRRWETEGAARLFRCASPGLLTAALIYWNRDQSIVKDYGILLAADVLVMLASFGAYGLMLRRRRSVGKAGRNAGRNINRNPDRGVVLLWLPACLCLFLFQNVYHPYMDRAVSREFYEEVTDESIGTLMSDMLEREQGFYRMEQLGSTSEQAADLNRIWDMGQYISSLYSSAGNEGYREFREEEFGVEQPFRNFLMQSVSRNPLFRRFMGVKYIVSREAVPGYELLRQKDGWKVYVNEQASPIAYATDRVMPEVSYEKLTFPYDQTALLEYAVVEDAAAGPSAGEDAAPESSSGAAVGEDAPENADRPRDYGGIRIEAFDPELAAEEEGEGWLQKTDSGYHVVTDKEKTAYLDIPGSPEVGSQAERILFVSFKVRNLKNADVSVRLEDVCNKLSAGSHIYYNGNDTFTYGVLLEQGEQRAELRFGAGEYEILDLDCFLGVTDQTAGADSSSELYASAFCPDWSRTGGNVIAGSVQAERPGYFVTTIPYDEGFEIEIDGARVETERVDLAFLGCRIGEGAHEVKIVYHAPGAAAGKALSLLGAIAFAGVLLRDRILKFF